MRLFFQIKYRVMAKIFFKDLLKKFHSTHEHPSLSFLKRWLKNENLWHINKHSVSGGLFIGFFCAFIPFPIQMPMAAIFSILFRTNFIISVISTWISNPITYVPLYTASYFIGLWLLDLPIPAIKKGIHLNQLIENIEQAWKPLLLGNLISGLALGALGYTSARIYWRTLVIRGWKLRKKRREKNNSWICPAQAH